MSDMTTTPERIDEKAKQAEALQWLVDQVKWERVLDGMRGRTPTTETPEHDDQQERAA
jgi:hypothetical protein